MNSSAATVHFDRNRQSRNDWDSFADHRASVTGLIQAVGRRRDANAKSDDESLVVLGVGNGNDLDLPSLISRYRSTTLVDLDVEAIEYCRSRLPADVSAVVDTASPVDLSGVLGRLPACDENASKSKWDTWLQQARNPDPGSVPMGDVVVSTCLISQLLDTVICGLPPDHPQLADAMLAVRDGHLNLLSRLTKPGGTAILITDMVSSDTLPQLDRVSRFKLPKLVRAAVESQNFFTGLNPAVLMHKLSPPENDRAASTAIHGPWRWRLGPRLFAVIAITTEMK
ncbi:hypothetical protein [Rubripirellula reticaptiva]|nr:hypothetical protein [Rubripirellula reticaptiva]